MDDPRKDGISPACWSSTVGNLNVHYSSGPNNHMFYLLSNGGTSKCNGAVVGGSATTRPPGSGTRRFPTTWRRQPATQARGRRR